MIRKPLLLCCFFLTSLISNVFAADKLEVSLAFWGDVSSMASLGVVQGIDEANLQGEFLGQSYRIKNHDVANLAHVSNVAAIFAVADEAVLRKLAKLNPDTPIFNLSDENNSLRENCIANLFHTIPSQKMRDDAVAQWIQKNPDSKASAAGWHKDFKKYAASQVNKRFSDLHEKAMDDSGYAGWIAMKAVADAVVRTSSTDGVKLMTFLKNDLVIDGAKGLKMNFRSTGQLRQMLLLVDKGDIVGEAPVRGVVDTTDLETLGILECTPCPEN
ncbi:MAG: ABC transporter substrate-binding protein [Gammaproteobacteria bacterium]